MWRTVAVIGLALGCGRVSFDEVAIVDAMPDADTSCWPAWRTGVTLEVPTRRTDLNTPAADKNPFLAADGLSLYFATNRPGGQGDLDFWLAQRGDAGASFTIVGPVAELNGTLDEGRLELDATGLVAVFSAIRAGGVGANDIYIATRTDTASPFVIDPTLTAAINSVGDDKDPHFLAGSAHRLYYTLGEIGFRVSARSAGGAYGAGQAVGVAALPGITRFADPQPSPDELTLVFSSGTTGTVLDFYVATRDATSEPFGNMRPLSVINTASLDRDISVTLDGCEVWYSSNLGGDEILMTRVVR